MTYRFASLDFDDGVNYIVDVASGPNPYRPAPRRVQRFENRQRPGGFLYAEPPGLRAVRLAGRILGPVGTGAWNTRRDALLAAFAKEKQRLELASDRYLIATAEAIETDPTDWGSGAFAAEFVSEDAYESAVTPSADVRTPTLTLLPGTTTGYGVSYNFTPGGNAPAPVRWYLLTRSGSVTPLLLQLRNLTTRESLGITSSVPAGSCVLIDPDQGVYVGAQGDIAGWWPLADADGPALDFSGNSRDLTENGTVLFRQDGPERFGTAIDHQGSTSNYLSSVSTAFDFAGAFSLCCWVRFGDGNNPASPWVLLSKAGTNQGYALVANSLANALNVVARLGGATRTARVTTEIAAGVWYFVCATADSSSLRIYLGTEDLPPRLEAVTTGGTLTASTNSLRIGTGIYTDNVAYASPAGNRLAMPALFSVALTADQIRRVWARGPQAYADAPAEILMGRFPSSLHRTGGTNTIQVQADHATTAPIVQFAAVWRSRWE